MKPQIKEEIDIKEKRKALASTEKDIVDIQKRMAVTETQVHQARAKKRTLIRQARVEELKLPLPGTQKGKDFIQGNAARYAIAHQRRESTGAKCSNDRNRHARNQCRTGRKAHSRAAYGPADPVVAQHVGRGRGRTGRAAGDDDRDPFG